MKKLLFLSSFILFVLQLRAQKTDCVFKQPTITIHFGSGNVPDLNTEYLINYDRVSTSCPTDGHYAFTGFTSDCFRGDWHTITDHTSADGNGNMMLVNAAPRSNSTFLVTPIYGLKENTIYEFGVWMMNVCKPSDKCPFPLLPNIIIRLETPDGKLVAKLSTGDLQRLQEPGWLQYRAQFTTPASVTSLRLSMTDLAPGGCGNDFALDDITLRECIIPPPVTKTKTTTKPSTTPPKKTAATTVKTTPKKPAKTPIKKDTKVAVVVKAGTDSLSKTEIKQPKTIFPPPPKALTTRENSVVKKIEAPAGEIKIDLYDNGEIDGDTVSIYHNNSLIASHAALSQKPITFRIAVNDLQPHHELVMVAENLGSIPPNTSLMIVTAGGNRYEVFISSTTQRNAKVVLDLKK